VAVISSLREAILHSNVALQPPLAEDHPFSLVSLLLCPYPFRQCSNLFLPVAPRCHTRLIPLGIWHWPVRWFFLTTMMMMALALAVNFYLRIALESPQEAIYCSLNRGLATLVEAPSLISYLMAFTFVIIVFVVISQPLSFGCVAL